MARSGALPPAGFIKQETIPLDRFLETRTGRLYAEHGRSGR
jgi:hypothetical protein